MPIYGVDLLTQIDCLIEASVASAPVAFGQSGHQMAGKACSIGRE
jgi:hypothetical protein